LPPEPQRNRSGRLGRFALEVTLPGLQGVADTSDWKLFGVPLKIVACQDPGARNSRFWESFALEDHEDHRIVIDVVKQALDQKPGAQLLTDQGTPYLAKAVEDACERLELEALPQKEAAATEKPTLERSFRTIKDALRPLESLSNLLAEAMPHLNNTLLAKTVGRLLLVAFLRVYAFAERKERDHPLAASADPVVLECVAEAQREKARAEDRSRKLTLDRIHRAYAFPGSRRGFIRAHRSYPVEDILEAERRMGEKACRCHARLCDRYFAAILRRVAERNGARRRRERRERLDLQESRAQEREAAARTKRKEADPERWVAEALKTLAGQYKPEKGGLLFGGAGPGRGDVRAAGIYLRETDPGAAHDRAEVGWKRWQESQEKADPGRDREVRKSFDRVVKEELGERHTLSTSEVMAAILKRPASDEDPRPPRGSPLRIWPAGSG